MTSRFPRPYSFRSQVPLRRLCPPPSQRLTLASHFLSKALPTPVHAHCGLASFSCPFTSSDCTSHTVSNMHAHSHLITFMILLLLRLECFSCSPGFIFLLNKCRSIFQRSALKTTCSINFSIISAKTNVPCSMIPKALCWYSLFTISNFCINRTLGLMRNFQIAHLI